MDDDHYIAIYDLNANGLLLTVKGGRDRILSIKFINDTTFVTTGIKHYKLWTINGNTARGRKGAFGTSNNIILCIATRGDDILAGASDGAI
mmetsp:Transcript_13274/g.2079  ORF Transcript_13274/g.2079 Transcript_13274/m.2079 type:complete len:91 (+) Transcript_13274:925-1197(+)